METQFRLRLFLVLGRFRPQVECRPTQYLLFHFWRQREFLELLYVLSDVRDAGTRPIGSEQRFRGNLVQPGKVAEQQLGRDSADIQVHVAMPSQQEKRSVHPERPATV